MNENNDINPRLEGLLKEELANRAEKLQTIERWKKDTQHKHRLFTMPAAVSGIAAILVAGWFIFFHNGNTEQQVFRGTLIDPAIYETLRQAQDGTLEAGNKAKAMEMIESSRSECSSQLDRLETLKVDADQQQELQERKQMLKQEISELDSLKTSIK